MLGRVKHQTLGHGFGLSQAVSGNGQLSSVVVFDNQPEIERTIYDSYLAVSTKPIPDKARTVVRKPRKKKVETPDEISDEIPDELLVTPPVRATMLDDIDIDELPEEILNESTENETNED